MATQSLQFTSKFIEACATFVSQNNNSQEMLGLETRILNFSKETTTEDEKIITLLNIFRRRKDGSYIISFLKQDTKILEGEYMGTGPGGIIYKRVYYKLGEILLSTLIDNYIKRGNTLEFTLDEIDREFLNNVQD